jgi:predicted nuclease of predicted toxin-antitoxin system
LRILLDENVDWRLKTRFPAGHEVVTVAEAGWAGKKNGEFLRLAAKEFDVFLTTDKGIPHQQNLSRFDLAVVLLRAKSNAYEDLAPLMDETNAAIEAIKPGILIRIPAEQTSNR